MAEFPPGVSGSERPWPSSDPPAAAAAPGSVLRRMEETEEMFRKQEIADRFVNLFSTVCMDFTFASRFLTYLVFSEVHVMSYGSFFTKSWDHRKACSAFLSPESLHDRDPQS